ncbi:hypothetical protein QQG91_10035 [Marivivens sp. LCG002]|uniref:hypothetical protein n=1 Tax=Marivivens sp. LCG002 TaxID=3051171 RepID=UPI0025540141|nr:hypothetical protein [Marivivens sp. LCG002]WIV50008.1 hypothetical protein QQG91_10035 [Marivivens sp. LCG002]
MLKSTWIIAATALIALGACMPSNDVERGVVGAAIGATVANLTGNDGVTGAAIGAGAGVFCDNVGAC